MFYIFFTSVFITLFLVVGTLAFWKFINRMMNDYPISWTTYQHVIILTVLAALCFILAVIFGIQIPDCYAPTTF